MKTPPKLVLALLAVVSCAASAETYSSEADQARRDRNREEALANYRAGNASAREQAHDVADSARRGTHKAAEATREVGHEVASEGRHVGHKVANESRSAGHKVAVKARDTTARADAKFGTVEKKDAHGEASNPTGSNTTASNGPKP
ncbi:MAG TPA: hypothetical protein VLD35_12440 [Caldimonas sp.]|nr:hypothetical protein [Caldimonas sp.]